MAPTLKKASEIDADKFVKLYNDASITNEQLCKKLGCDWPAITVKAKVSKTVAAQLTLKRSGGTNPATAKIEKLASGKTGADAVKRASAMTATESASAAAVAEEAAGPMKIRFVVMGNGSTALVDRQVEAPNHEELMSSVANILAEARTTKGNYYRNGNVIDYADIKSGDTITFRARLHAAA